MVVGRLAEQICDRHPQAAQLLLETFSTTGPLEAMVGQLTLLNGYRAYFDYAWVTTRGLWLRSMTGGETGTYDVDGTIVTLDSDVGLPSSELEFCVDGDSVDLKDDALPDGRLQRTDLLRMVKSNLGLLVMDNYCSPLAWMSSQLARKRVWPSMPCSLSSLKEYAEPDLSGSVDGKAMCETNSQRTLVSKCSLGDTYALWASSLLRDAINDAKNDAVLV